MSWQYAPCDAPPDETLLLTPHALRLTPDQVLQRRRQIWRALWLAPAPDAASVKRKMLCARSVRADRARRPHDRYLRLPSLLALSRLLWRPPETQPRA